MTKQKLITFSLAILALWSGSLYYVFATPPVSPYAVSENITDPSCAPGALNCYVSVVTADNGLTATGSNVQLGGTLTNSGSYTVIDGAGYTQGLEISGLDTAYLKQIKISFYNQTIV
jgi:hypothetical protein